MNDYDDDPKGKGNCMPSVITLILIAYFGVALFGPAFGLKVEPNMGQTLMNLVIAVVSYFVGTTQQSAKKDETIATITKGTP